MFKKFFAILVATMVLFSGCGSSSSGSKLYSMKDMGVTNEKGQSIYLGMSRTDAEKILGQSTGVTPDASKITIYPTIGIFYRDDKIACIKFNNDSNSSTWNIKHNIHIGSSEDDFLKAYNLKIHKDLNIGLYTLMFKENGKNLELLHDYTGDDLSHDEVATKNKAKFNGGFYCIFDVSIDDTGVTHIMISDEKYTKLLK